MARPTVLAAAAILAALRVGAAVAQPVDCQADDLTQAEMTRCAEQAWQAAEGDLSLALGLALTEAQVIDRDKELAGVEAPLSTEAALEAAQAAWLDYRDAACASEALVATAEADQEMIGALCLARLTQARAEDLRLFFVPN